MYDNLGMGIIFNFQVSLCNKTASAACPARNRRHTFLEYQFCQFHQTSHPGKNRIQIGTFDFGMKKHTCRSGTHRPTGAQQFFLLGSIIREHVIELRRKPTVERF
ncbi:hypothetical protein [Dyadobacter sp. 50-39]|uniref:hypothetical protein n=1 Tax=Dyadobacter sp. 50-39 TaxID=1895756 RepID=UPI0025C62B9C|nr:hypothetical protein [Dyadobacter sp. 50-39]